MSLSNDKLALIDTLMYCENVVSAAIKSDSGDNFDFGSYLRRIFYKDDGSFNSSVDRFGYPDDLQKVVEAILNDPELCKLKVVATLKSSN